MHCTHRKLFMVTEMAQKIEGGEKPLHLPKTESDVDAFSDEQSDTVRDGAPLKQHIKNSNTNSKPGLVSRLSFRTTKSEQDTPVQAAYCSNMKEGTKAPNSVTRNISRRFSRKSSRKSEIIHPDLNENEKDNAAGAEPIQGCDLKVFSESDVDACSDEQSDTVRDGAPMKQPIKNSDMNSKPGLVSRLSFRRRKSELDTPGQFAYCSNMKEGTKVPNSVTRNISRRFSRKSSRKSEITCPDLNEIEEANAAGAEPIQECDLQVYSVMEVHELIQHEKIQEAFSVICSMEKELLEESESMTPQDSYMGYDKRVRDVEYLFKYLFEKMKSAIKDTLGKPHIDEKLLTSVVRVISEEDQCHPTGLQEMAAARSDTLGSPRHWKDLWKEIVQESLKDRISTLPLEGSTCIAVHLALIPKLISEDLRKVKCSVKQCYTEQFEVCDTYLKFYHCLLSQHIQDNILSKTLEFKDVIAVLDWILNTYNSESLMGSPDLKPEFNTEALGPLFDSDVLNKLQNDYITSLQETINKYMSNLLKSQKKHWNNEDEPETELQDGTSTPCLYIDIQEMIGEHVRASTKLSEHLKNETIRVCLQELANFIPRLSEDFIEWNRSKMIFLFMTYFVSYLNCFCILRNKLQETDTSESKKLEDIIIETMEKLKEHFFVKLEEQTQPHFQKLLTRKWISGNKSFSSIMDIISPVTRELGHLELPYMKDYLCEIHKCLVKEYIAQIMKQRIRLNRANRKEAAKKMRKEAQILNCAITNLGSDSDWLCPALLHICDIVHIKEEDSIKNHLKELLIKYPELSEQHVSAILYLQGTGRKKTVSMLKYFKDLKKNIIGVPRKDREIFAKIDSPTQVPCLPVFKSV